MMMMHLITQNRVAASRTLALGFLLAALLAASLLVAKPAHASTTFTVDRNDDPDPATANACTVAPSDCSLRGAIVAANAATGEDDITLPAGTYTLTIAGANEEADSTGDLDITDGITITGAGARSTSVVGGAAPFDDRIFNNHSGAKTTITGLTITGGKPGISGGGGVRNNGGDLTLDEVAVNRNNTEGSVGGIFGEGGTLNLIDSTVSGNSASNFGGIGQQKGGIVNITNSTISGNKASSVPGLSGGIIAAEGTTMNIRNSTIASNESGRLGGGILTAGATTLVIVKNTIVAGNSIDNCDSAQLAGGIISSQGNNISSDNSCPFTQPTDKQNTNPLLGPLQDNGGPTDTHALLPMARGELSAPPTSRPPSRRGWTAPRSIELPSSSSRSTGTEAQPRSQPYR